MGDFDKTYLTGTIGSLKSPIVATFGD